METCHLNQHSYTCICQKVCKHILSRFQISHCCLCEQIKNTATHYISNTYTLAVTIPNSGVEFVTQFLVTQLSWNNSPSCKWINYLYMPPEWNMTRHTCTFTTPSRGYINWMWVCTCRNKATSKPILGLLQLDIPVFYKLSRQTRLGDRTELWDLQTDCRLLSMLACIGTVANTQ